MDPFSREWIEDQIRETLIEEFELNEEDLVSADTQLFDDLDLDSLDLIDLWVALEKRFSVRLHELNLGKVENTITLGEFYDLVESCIRDQGH